MVKWKKIIFSDELLHALEKGSWDEIQSFMNDHPTEKLVDSNGTHLLHVAAKYNRTDLIKYLIESKCEINIKNSSGMTPCEIATRHNNVEAAAIFIETNTATFSVKVNGFSLKTGMKKWQNKRAPVIRDFYEQMIEDGVKIREVAEIFVKHGIDLCEIVRLHDPLLTKAALQLKCDCDDEGYEKHVMKKFDLNHVKILFHCGSEIDSITSTCLDYIMSNMRKYQHSKKGRTFLKGLFDWDIINERHLVWLEDALIGAKYKSVKIFLKYEFHAVAKAKCDRDLLACLFGNSNPKVIELLKTENIDVNSRAGFEDRTPLHYAAGNGVYENVKYLLERDADPETLDSYNGKPLYRALLKMEFCINHHVTEKLAGLEKCFKLLLQSGGNILLTDKSTTSKIFWRVFHRHSLFGKFCINTVNLLIMHVATYHSLNMSMNGYETMFPLEIPSKYKEQLRSLYQLCREQLKLLKSHKICEIYSNTKQIKINMLTILAEDPRKIAHFFKKEHLQTMKAFMNSYKKNNLHQYYYDTIEEHVKIITKVNFFRDAAIGLIAECSGIFDINHIILENIMKYLTYKDLIMFK